MLQRARMSHIHVHVHYPLAVLYHGETWELMARRWMKLERDFLGKSGVFDISKVPDIYDCVKYDLQHNRQVLISGHAEELYTYAKNMADVVIPQEYGTANGRRGGGWLHLFIIDIARSRSLVRAKKSFLLQA